MKRRRKARLGGGMVRYATQRNAVLALAIIAAGGMSVYAAGGGMGSLAVLGSSQLAVANEGDKECTPDFDYTCPFGTPKEQCPSKQKPGGQGKPCQDTTNGHTTQGKCVFEMKCQGEAGGGDGKGGEMPKMPEMPKKEQQPQQQQPQNQNQDQGGCTPTLDASGNYTTPEYNTMTGERCPRTATTTTSVGDVWYATSSTSTDDTSTTTATTTGTAVSRAWSAFVHTVSTGVQTVGNFFTGNSNESTNRQSVQVNPSVTTQTYVLNPQTGLLEPVNTTQVYTSQTYNTGSNSTLGDARTEAGTNIFTATTTAGGNFFSSTLDQLKSALLSLSGFLTSWSF